MGIKRNVKRCIWLILIKQLRAAYKEMCLSVSRSKMVLYLIIPMKHRRERPVCRSGGNDVEPGDNPRRCPVDRGFAAAHRPFPTVKFGKAPYS